LALPEEKRGDAEEAKSDSAAAIKNTSLLLPDGAKSNILEALGF
jgi:hypothetical protein